MTRRTRGLACHTSTEQTITKTPSQKAKPALPLLQPPQNIPLPPNRSQRRRPLPTPPQRLLVSGHALSRCNMHRGSLRVNVALLDSRMFVAAAFFVWDSEWGVFFSRG